MRRDLLSLPDMPGPNMCKHDEAMSSGLELIQYCQLNETRNETELIGRS
jgi:hypothetical protein